MYFLLFLQGYDPDTFKAAKKAKPRSSAAGSSGGEAIDMKAAVESGTVTKLTVAVLKTWLKTQGVQVTNKKKAQLIEDVESLF